LTIWSRLDAYVQMIIGRRTKSHGVSNLRPQVCLGQRAQLARDIWEGCGIIRSVALMSWRLASIEDEMCSAILVQASPHVLTVSLTVQGSEEVRKH